MTATKYFYDSSTMIHKEEKWHYLLMEYVEVCDTIEFNILRYGFDKDLAIMSFFQNSDPVPKKASRVYNNGRRFSCHLNYEIINFISGFSFSDWNGFYFEDLSLLKDGIEVFATITHENYIVILMEGFDCERLNSLGFQFAPFLNDT